MHHRAVRPTVDLGRDVSAPPACAHVRTVSMLLTTATPSIGQADVPPSGTVAVLEPVSPPVQPWPSRRSRSAIPSPVPLIARARRRAVDDAARNRQREAGHGSQKHGGAQRPTSSRVAFICCLLFGRKLLSRTGTDARAIHLALRRTSCDKLHRRYLGRLTADHLPQYRCRRHDLKLGSERRSSPPPPGRLRYLSPPWVSGILNAVDPVWRAQGKSHWACPAQGVSPAIAFPAASTPCRASRTCAIAGSAHPQSVMALPASIESTQLISTAPPSISTQASQQSTRTRGGGRRAGFMSGCA